MLRVIFKSVTRHVKAKGGKKADFMGCVCVCPILKIILLNCNLQNYSNINNKHDKINKEPENGSGLKA